MKRLFSVSLLCCSFFASAYTNELKTVQGKQVTRVTCGDGKKYFDFNNYEDAIKAAENEKICAPYGGFVRKIESVPASRLPTWQNVQPSFQEIAPARIVPDSASF